MKRTEIPTLEDVRDILEMPDLVGAERGSIEHTIGVVLIFSCFVGENIEQLHIQTGIPVPTIEAIMAILKRNGVFSTSTDRFSEYFEDANSGITLNLDICCGQDLLQRTVKNGEPAFRMTELGVEYGERLMAEHPDALDFLEKVIGDKKKASDAYLANQTKHKGKGERHS